MKINILDAGIKDRAGRHYDYGLKLARQYARAGHDVHVYGSAAMTAEAEADFRPFAKFTRLFSTSPNRGASDYDWFAGELTRLRVDADRIAGELAGAGEADIWLWPALSPADLDACMIRGLAAPIVGCINEDPGVQSGSLEAQIWRSTLLSAKGAGLAVTLVCVEPELRHRLMEIVPEGRLAVVPSPASGPPISRPRAGLKRVGLFGHEGQDMSAKTTEMLLRRLAADGFAITFQVRDPAIRVPNVVGVDRIGRVRNIGAAIAECDLVVLPYGIQRYHARGSGVLAECLALGVPAAAPIGTLPARTIEQLRIGPVFRNNNAGPIYHAIKTAERDYESFARNAYSNAEKFCSRNGPGRFASALLAAAAAGTS